MPIRRTRPRPPAKSCARFSQHTDASEWRIGGLFTERRGRVALAQTSRIARGKEPSTPGANVPRAGRANAAGEHPLASRETKGRAARRSVDPQRFSGRGAEPCPARVEQAALADD